MNQSAFLKIYHKIDLIELQKWKMQNLSQSELKQIIKMWNWSQNELEQIAKKRSIKNCNNMSKEGLLIPLLKSKQSHAELYKIKSNNRNRRD